MRQRTRFLWGWCVVCGIVIGGPAAAADRIDLKEGWAIQSSAEVDADGAALSAPGYNPAAWYPTQVPATLLAALVENGVYPDPYFSDNLKDIPGFQEGRWLRMDPSSPFYPPWWYRTEFTVPASFDGQSVVLHLDGINYQANVWLNGTQIATSADVIGMFRRFEFDVTDHVGTGAVNALAIEIIAPGKLPDEEYRTKQLEATTGWDDHNPQPPDLNAGIWRDVYLTATGPIRLRHPYVATDLDLPGLDVARLTVTVDVVNAAGEPVTGVVAGRIEDIAFSQEVSLAPHEQRTVVFDPAEFAQLVVAQPRVWWPHPVGPQELYHLDLSATVDGAESDASKTRFGIREATTYIDDEGWRGYRVNGRNILIRGGAWMTADMLLRLDTYLVEGLVRYAREANLNMLRSEGFSIRETDEFYALCDELGVMVTQQIFGRNIPDEPLAVACIEDMILRTRNHPSLVHFLGHDETFPTETLDQAYRDLIAKYTPDRTYQPHSGAFDVAERFETGGTRTGTLELWTYANPKHYYTHKDDGAWGFAQSGGIGGIAAPLDSMRKMLKPEELWPPQNEAWSFHTVLQTVEYFGEVFDAIDARYGGADSIEAFCLKAQVLNYESARGMYEAYGRNKYDAKGITTWKYNVAWPATLTWQYIDWYLAPTGAYYGAKKACEAVHAQYSYDDHSVWVVNGLYEPQQDLTVRAAVYTFDMRKVWDHEAVVSVGPDGKTEAFKVAWPEALSTTHFLRLDLLDGAGTPVSNNFYWLSTVPDVPGEVGRKPGAWVLDARPESVADFTQLNGLEPVTLEVATSAVAAGDEQVVTVQLVNPTDRLAFFIQLNVAQGADGPIVHPAYWSENYFSLLPGESRTVTARVPARVLAGAQPTVRVGGWNVAP